MNEPDGERKRELSRRIRETEANLKRLLSYDPAPDGSVDWRVQFVEVFDHNGGFDVVLANPPYVRQELIRPIKPQLQKVYGPLYSGTADLYVYFYYRAIQLLRPGGMLVFISSNKWFRAGYGVKLRSHITKSAAILSITDFGDLPVFESAAAYPMIFIAQKGESGRSTRLTLVKSLSAPYPDVSALIEQLGQVLPSGALSGDSWSLSDSDLSLRLQAKTLGETPLGKYVQGRFYRGVLTGFNAAFIINGAQRAELIARDPRSAEVIRPLVVGRNVHKWQVDYPDKWLIFTRRGIQIDRYPAVKRHLEQWRAELTPKKTGKEEKGRKPGRYQWYEIQDDIAYYAAFDKPKIVYPVIAKESPFAFDDRGALTNDKVFIIPTGDMYLLGVLNSSIAWNMLDSICSKLRGGFLELRAVHLSKLPIPDAPASERAAITELVQQCLDVKGRGPQVAEWEAEINARVARLYGLSG